ncbi:MAG: SDR family NAD(P)-dependent oxidoreductase [Candidatus Methylacidiphilales bacterium]
MKTALVTGAGSWLGQAIAKHLAAQGYATAIHVHRAIQTGEALQQSICSAGGHAMLLAGDLTKEADVKALCRTWSSQCPSDHLDVLIHNAGVYDPVPFLEADAETWSLGIDTTATAFYFLTREMLPHLRKSSTGRIITIGDSSCEHLGARGRAPSYHMGKTGLVMLMRSFARCEAPHGVTCNMISPGILENSISPPPLDQMPTGRYGTTADILHAIDFLIHPAARYCSGSNLILSGGWNLGSSENLD